MKQLLLLQLLFKKITLQADMIKPIGSGLKENSKRLYIVLERQKKELRQYLKANGARESHLNR